MTENLEFLAVVHNLQNGIKAGISLLSEKIDDANGEDTVQVSTEMLIQIRALLEVDHVLVAKLIEENESMRDTLQNALNRILMKKK